MASRAHQHRRRQAGANVCQKIGRTLSAIPTESALLTYTAAAEKGYLGAVKLENYKRSEHFHQHKKAVNSAVANALQYAADHPEDIRKAIETLANEQRKNELHRQNRKIMQDAAAQEALKREYEVWKQDEIAKNKAYYDLSGTEPTHEQFLNWKKNQEDARKAAARAEGRKI